MRYRNSGGERRAWKESSIFRGRRELTLGEVVELLNALDDIMTNHTFQLTTIDLHIGGGLTVEARALVCNGLAIHKGTGFGSKDSVSVTYVGAGKAILVGHRFDYVLKILPRLLAVCDWTRSVEEVFADKAAHDLCVKLQRGDDGDDFSEAAILSDDRP